MIVIGKRKSSLVSLRTTGGTYSFSPKEAEELSFALHQAAIWVEKVEEDTKEWPLFDSSDRGEIIVNRSS